MWKVIYHAAITGCLRRAGNGEEGRRVLSFSLYILTFYFFQKAYNTSAIKT